MVPNSPSKHTSSIASRFSDWLSYALVAVGLIYIAAFLVVAALRIRYPFELEWLESSMADMTGRVLHGLPLYVKPSLDYIPAIYTPLYFVISAAFAKIMGLDYLPLRIVSLLSTLGCFCLIYALVRKESGRIRPGLIAAGLFAATYAATGTFFDMARVDSFELFLLLLGAVTLYRAESPLRLIISAICLTAAFLAKQSALAAIGMLAIYAIYAYRLRSLWFLITLGALMGGSILWLNHSSDSWFYYYVFKLPGNAPFEKSMLVQFWFRDLLKAVPIFCVASLILLLDSLRNGRYRLLLFLLCLLAGFGAISFLARYHVGGYVNTLMPIYAALAVSAGLVYGNSDRRQITFGLSRDLFSIVFAVLLLAQFVLLYYNPVSLVPSKEMAATGQKLVDIVAQTKGDVYAPCQGFLLTKAGKPSVVSQQAIADLTIGDKEAASELGMQLLQSIQSRKYSLVIVDREWQSPQFDSLYVSIPNPLGDSAGYHAWSGGEQHGPRHFYIARNASPSDSK